jgi:putative thiamine transport system permease protein
MIGPTATASHNKLDGGCAYVAHPPFDMKRLPLPILPIVTLLAMLGPVLAGLYGTVLPAFGHLPAAGLTGPSLDPFRDLFGWGGLPRAVLLSLTTGLLVRHKTVSRVRASFIATSFCAPRSRCLWPGVPDCAIWLGIALVFAGANRMGSPARSFDRTGHLGADDDPWLDH